MNRLTSLASKNSQRADEINKKIKSLEANLKQTAYPLTLFYMLDSYEYGEVVKHICVVWHSRQNRLLYAIYSTPNHPYSFKYKRVIFKRPLIETDMKTRLFIGDTFLFDDFPDLYVDLIEDDIRGCFIYRPNVNECEVCFLSESDETTNRDTDQTQEV